MSSITQKTMRLYNAGLEIDDAVLRGADRRLFASYEIKYKGGSIPLCDLLGFTPTKPYSCDYHTGGDKGEMLRQIAKQSLTV